MQEIIIELKAPFLSCRTFNSGYGYTTPTIPHSGAYGLVLNLAGFNMLDYGKEPIQAGKEALVYPCVKDMPGLEISVGLISTGNISALLHQYHKHSLTPGVDIEYFGRKPIVSIGKREYVSSYHGVIGVRGDDDIIEKVSRGTKECYGGIPFAGQRNLFFSEINLVSGVKAKWFKTDLDRGEQTIFLTTGIDRADSSNTKGELFALSAETESIPASAWVTPYH